jgi:flagellar biosynthetic protein FliP
MKRLLWTLLGFAMLGLLLAAEPAMAQSVTVDAGEQGALTNRVIQLIGLLTVLALAPSILIMTTSFVRIVVVLSLLRTATGLQQSPPNMVLISLSLFLTFAVMAPVFQQSYEQGIEPLMNEEMELSEAFLLSAAPIKTFMLTQTREADLALFLEISKLPIPASAEETPLHIVAPAFMISELRTAFEIGFRFFIPFLVIDLVVASILMSMGMMMLPPVVISLPFKLVFFVLVDGWHLVVGALVRSFN